MTLPFLGYTNLAFQLVIEVSNLSSRPGVAVRGVAVNRCCSVVTLSIVGVLAQE